MSAYLHYSIGPVQGFVAKARRTGDLWTGSFLLSYLAARAIHAVEELNGVVTKPKVPENDELLKWMRGQNGKPTFGSVPNAFVAQFSSDAGAARAGAQVTTALQSAWREIADYVWEKFVAPAAESGKDTAAIWQQQVDSFWEFNWVVSADATGFEMACRKYTRTGHPHAAHGTMCTLMPELQEISGFVRSAGEREKQDRFWGQVARKFPSQHEIKKHERLSAIALIKRAFRNVLSKLSLPQEMKNWPSVTDIATRAWLQSIPESAQPLLENHRAAIRNMGSIDGIPGKGSGDWYHRSEIDKLQTKETAGAFSELKQTLSALLGFKGVQSPPRFYAVLLADGDRLGETIRSMQSPEKISEALGEFTSLVPEIMQNHQGRAIYAGGDDVLALLPLEHALKAAQEMQKRYMEIMHEFGAGDKASISCAVVFAALHYPLQMVLKEAHYMLDDVAKAQNGRDSLALSLLKTGGLQARWASRWKHTENSDSTIDDIEKLLQHLDAKMKDGGLSHTALRALPESLNRLNHQGRWQVADRIDMASEVFEQITLARITQLEDETPAQQRRKEQVNLLSRLMDTSRLSAGREKGFCLDFVSLLSLLHTGGDEGRHL